MNADTEYVRMHVINYEPTWLALVAATDAWEADQTGPLAPYRDQLRDAVEEHYRAMGLRREHLTDDVDYAEIIELEFSDR